MGKRKSNSLGSRETSPATRCLFYLLVTIAEVLLFGVLGLMLYWLYQYDLGIGWGSDNSISRDDARQKQFNLHYVLMLGGFIFLNGQSILTYRLFTCCKKIYVKVLHTIWFVLSISAITIGIVAAFQGQSNRTGQVVHFYTLHSWIGLTTVGLFALQFIFGFFSFLVLLCCDTSTAKFRQKVLPTHIAFGLIVFNLSIGTCLTGLMQTARSRLKGQYEYKDFSEPALCINVLSVSLVALAIVIPYIVMNNSFKRYSQSQAIENN